MRGIRSFRKWAPILAASTERDFERKVLPFLRLLWPSLIQPEARGPWDRKGIDLLAWVDSGPFPCVVQCKGFIERGDLNKSHIDQVEKSIEAFRNSDVSANVYLLVHNRDARFQEFNKRVSELLRGLVSDGKAEKAELWDYQTLFKRVFDRMQNILNAALREHSRNLLEHFQSLFVFGHYYIPVVPVAEKKLVFERGKPCSLEEIYSGSYHDISQLLLSHHNSRWTLLTGIFGTGKTTSVLHAATSSDRVIIFVQCATLPSSPLINSTNLLLEEVTKSLGILDEFEDQDREVLYEIAGPVLGYLLRRPESPYALILDGLDENRAYANLRGLQYLSNQLADLTCPIIMTTRKEHIEPMFGNFSLAFYEFSTKKGPRRTARLLELVRWEKEQVVQLVNQILINRSEVEKQRLSEFMSALNSGEYIDRYGELPFHPLFLQFILEDVATQGIRRATRALLLRSWVERKIWRDREIVERATDDSIDTVDFVARMIELMENIANLMTNKTETHELTEFIDSDFVNAEAERLFNMSSDSVLSVLLNSVLVPQSPRRKSSFNITFAFRVLHEFLLASYLVRENLACDTYPDTVRSFYSEITESCFYGT